MKEEMEAGDEVEAVEEVSSEGTDLGMSGGEVPGNLTMEMTVLLDMLLMKMEMRDMMEETGDVEEDVVEVDLGEGQDLEDEDLGVDLEVDSVEVLEVVDRTEEVQGVIEVGTGEVTEDLGQEAEDLGEEEGLGEVITKRVRPN